MEIQDFESWVRNKEIYRSESWTEYLQQLMTVHAWAKRFKEFHNWLFRTFNGRSIRSIPEELKNSARMCVSGGNLAENAFGRLMFDNFGFQVEYCDTYEKSLQQYKKYGDFVKLVVGNKILGIEDYDKFLGLLERTIDHLSKVTGKTNSEIESDSENFAEWVKYPNPVLPDKLEVFLNELAGLLLYANYYTFLTKYFEYTPLVLLANFLDCDARGVRTLANLWEIEHIYDNRFRRVAVGEINDDNLYELFWISQGTHSTLQYILQLFSYKGYALQIIRNFSNIEGQLKEFWMELLSSLRELRINKNWNLDDEIREALETLCRLELSEKDASMLIKVAPEGKVDSVHIQKWKMNKWIDAVVGDLPEISRSGHGAYSPIVYTVEELTPTDVLEQLFPLLATGFMYVLQCEEEKRVIRVALTGRHLKELLEVLEIDEEAQR